VRITVSGKDADEAAGKAAEALAGRMVSLRRESDQLEGIVERLGKDEPCTARIWHGPGHQSSTPCEVKGPHEVHRAIYGSDRTEATWKDGSYTNGLRERGIEFDPESYPENMAMTGFFDEPPQDDE
jgi:hypothetical protein